MLQLIHPRRLAVLTVLTLLLPANLIDAGPSAAAATRVPVSVSTMVSSGMPSAARPRATVFVRKGTRLMVNVNPNLNGDRAWKVRVERKRKGAWRTVCTCNTIGAAETLSLNVPKGTYRVRLLPRAGYSTRGAKATVRFDPTHSAADSALPASAPPGMATTAPAGSAPSGTAITPSTTTVTVTSSSSGFPGVGSSGVPAGVVLRPSGPLVITTANQVVDGLDISGTVEVRASGVVIRNSRIRGTGSYGLYVRSGSVTLSDSEISGGFENAIGYHNWTAIRVNIFGVGGDGVKLGSNTRLEDSWLHDFKPFSGAHADGAQLQAGETNIIVRHNTIDLSTTANANAALFIAPDLGPSSPGPLTIENNYLNGGNYTTFIADGNNGQYYLSNITLRNNTFGRNYSYGALRINVPATITNNTYTDGTPVK